MSPFLKTPLSILSVLWVLLSSLIAKPSGGHKIVFLYGDRSHASGDHEFQAGSHLLAKHLNVQNEIEVKAVVNAGCLLYTSPSPRDS